jgi:hypothetical protein
MQEWRWEKNEKNEIGVKISAPFPSPMSSSSSSNYANGVIMRVTMILNFHLNFLIDSFKEKKKDSWKYKNFKEKKKCWKAIQISIISLFWRDGFGGGKILWAPENVKWKVSQYTQQKHNEPHKKCFESHTPPRSLKFTRH